MISIDNVFSAKIDKDVRHFTVNILGVKMKFRRKMPFKTYAGKPLYIVEEGNKLLSELLKSKEPFFCSRFGNSELFALTYYIENINNDNIIFPESRIRYLRDNAGFFSASNNLILRYCMESIEIIKNMDLIATMWYNEYENMTLKFAEFSKLVDYGCIYPLIMNQMKEPWIQYLNNKKVLIIHPFEKTILSQYNNLDKLYENSKMAPNYELLTLKTVQTIGNNYKNYQFKDWFEALEYMYKEIDKKDFDVALIAGGAYGMFLGNHVKNIGKQAIQMCGALQLLFGIKGSRWDNSGIYNDYWVAPDESERVKDMSKFLQAEGNLAYW